MHSVSAIQVGSPGLGRQGVFLYAGALDQTYYFLIFEMAVSGVGVLVGVGGLLVDDVLGVYGEGDIDIDWLGCAGTRSSA